MNAFFLDRDGVIIEEKNYLCDPAKVRLCQGTPEAFRMIGDAGYKIIVVSNQSGVARGYFSMDDVMKVQNEIIRQLRTLDCPVPDAWYNCPHHPKGTVPEYTVDCDCRKPKPGMILRAVSEKNIDLKGSFIIGDKTSDLESGFLAGCSDGCLVLTGHGSKQIPELNGKKVKIAENLLNAVIKLLNK